MKEGVLVVECDRADWGQAEGPRRKQVRAKNTPANEGKCLIQIDFPEPSSDR
jgi:hypothetical protein